MNCNLCGSSNVIEGTIIDSSSGGGNAWLFVSKDKPLYKQIFGIGGNKILSLACVHCGNLQFMVEFSEKDKERYVEFEGRQPSLMERINDESETS
jgi:predicted nucleic-acid-binding Zn-ribbon protein